MFFESWIKQLDANYWTGQSCCYLRKNMPKTKTSHMQNTSPNTEYIVNTLFIWHKYIHWFQRGFWLQNNSMKNTAERDRER